MEKKFIFILTFSFLAVLATVQANSSVLLPVWSLDSEYSSIVTDGTCPLAFGTLQSRESSSCLCVGDFNGDGYVDLLDVAPFVEILNSGRFDPCADINGDGHVNLLDVGPFVDLIQTGGNCAGESAASKGATREDFSQEETNNTLNKLYEQLGMERLVSDLQIFPNPASDVLQVALDMNKSASITLHIYNISGQKMFAQKVQASKGHNTIPISVNTLTSGLYLLEINDGNSLKTKNFTIDK